MLSLGLFYCLFSKSVQIKHILQPQNPKTYDTFYTSLYGIGSDAIHSGWLEINQLYISELGMSSHDLIIKKDSDEVHYRYFIPHLVLLCDSVLHYVNWLKNDGLKTEKEIISGVKNKLTACMEEVFRVYRDDSEHYLYT